MNELLSVGLDVGTTTTQMVLSRLSVENRSAAFAVPELHITRRQILYQSPIHFTPLLGRDRVDGEKIRLLLRQEYQNAGIDRTQVDTGAIIITGESGRKENARAVVAALSEFAGDFVVATAGPHLESMLAAKGAGANRFSEETGKTVLHMDIGGGTANLALIRNGKIEATGCMNVGGRLVKLDQNGAVCYRSPVLDGLFPFQVGQLPPADAIAALCRTLTTALEMAAGLTAPTSLLQTLWTAEAGKPWMPPREEMVLSFSGGVADCIEASPPPLAFGDIGPALGSAIRRSKLCHGQYRLGAQTIRATVIGAGCHATQLSGSTVFHRGISFPLKNLPVVCVDMPPNGTPAPQDILQRLSQQEGDAVLVLSGLSAAHYDQVAALAALLADIPFPGAVILALQADLAKALGHALALRLPPDKPILCLDRVRLQEGCYLDVGSPVDCALPIVIKTLILEK